MSRVNVGPTDRTLRIALGVLLLTLGMAQGASTWWGWLGIVPLATGLARYCPLWETLGISTARAPREVDRR